MPLAIFRPETVQDIVTLMTLPPLQITTLQAEAESLEKLLQSRTEEIAGLKVHIASLAQQRANESKDIATQATLDRELKALEDHVTQLAAKEQETLARLNAVTQKALTQVATGVLRTKGKRSAQDRPIEGVLDVKRRRPNVVEQAAASSSPPENPETALVIGD